MDTNQELVDKLLAAAHVGGMAALWPNRRTRETYQQQLADEARLREELLNRLKGLDVAMAALQAIAREGEGLPTAEQTLAREALVRIRGA